MRYRPLALGLAGVVLGACSGGDDDGAETETDAVTVALESTTAAPMTEAPTTTALATTKPSDAPTTTSPPRTTEAPTDERTGPEPLGEARARWEAAGVDSYDFTIRYTTEFLNGTYRISVRDGVAVSAERVPPKAGVDYLNDPESELPTTIDEVFDRVEREVAAPVFEVGFDDALGYPTHVFADPIEGVVDDELEFVIEDFADRTAAN